MYYSVDALENAIVRLVGDDESCIAMPLAALPKGLKQGDILQYEGGIYTQCPKEAARRRAEIIRILMGK
ncbi:MAG: DUF3006 domain-containing protein [Oscillospiraceae bacterium]